jgi:hypothetical protein
MSLDMLISLAELNAGQNVLSRVDKQQLSKTVDS